MDRILKYKDLIMDVGRFALPIDPISLTLAFAEVESGFNQYATRYEPTYRWLYKPDFFAHKNNITTDTEIVHQKTSWGMFQIMGAVAREHMYELQLPKIVCDVELQITLLWKHLKKLYDFYNSIAFAIAGYNAGFGLNNYNTQYYRNIMKSYKKFTNEEVAK